MFGLVNKPAANDAEQPRQTRGTKPEDFARSIYVSAASSDMERADRVMAQLSAAGMIVTSTWVDVIRKVGDANPMSAPRDQRLLWSGTDLFEVSLAQTLLLLLPPKGVATSGAWVELGYAAALQAFVDMMREAGQPVPAEADRWLVCAGEERSIFSALCDHYATDDDAVAAIVKTVLEPR